MMNMICPRGFPLFSVNIKKRSKIVITLNMNTPLINISVAREEIHITQLHSVRRS